MSSVGQYYISFVFQISSVETGKALKHTFDSQLTAISKLSVVRVTMKPKADNKVQSTAKQPNRRQSDQFTAHRKQTICKVAGLGKADSINGRGKVL